VFLGWQAVCALGLATAVVHLPQWVWGRWIPRIRRARPAGWLALLVLAWILAWSRLLELFPALGWTAGLPVT